MACIYDIHASWEDNLRRGPSYNGPLPLDRARPPPDQWFDFLGFKVASRLGVPAGPLLDSKWTTLAARLGYDIVTYKTVRSSYSPGHAPPNVLYLELPGQLPAAAAAGAPPLTAASQEPSCCSAMPSTPGAFGHAATTNGRSDRSNGCTSGGAAAAPSAAAPPLSFASAADIAITNSFGMPSMGPDYLLSDIPKAQAALGPGQLLVISVTGSPDRADGVSFADDFVEASQLAKAAGARVVEANYSCPNVGRGQGALYTDPAQVSAITRALVAALGPEVPLIIKVGAFESPELLAQVLEAAAGAGARGVAGINGLSRAIVTRDGAPALGLDRPTSGVCGAPIRAAALAFVAAARAAIDAGRLGLALVGVGGVAAPEHVDAMLAAGADVVQSATGMMWHPGLAAEYHEQQQRRAAARPGRPAGAA